MFIIGRSHTDLRKVSAAFAIIFAVLAAASLGVPHAAHADTYTACSQPTVSGPVRAADGRVYVRGYSSGCTASWRITITLKRNGVAIASSTQYYWSGAGSAAVFSPGACTRGSGYQGVALVSAYWGGAWHDVTYGTSGSQRVLC